jgi:hypothetical protein
VIPVGRHGGDGAAVARALGLDPRQVLDLSMSLNPFAPDIESVAGRHLDALTRYPDPTDATVALATAIGTDPARLLLTSGGSEAIAIRNRSRERDLLRRDQRRVLLENADAAHIGRHDRADGDQRHGHDRECDQHLDQGEAALAILNCWHRGARQCRSFQSAS